MKYDIQNTVINFFVFFTTLYIANVLKHKAVREHFLEKMAPMLSGYMIGTLINYLLVKYKKQYLNKYIILFYLFILIFLGLYIRYKRYNKQDYTEPAPGEAPSLPSEKINMERKKDMRNEYSFELPNYSEKYLDTAGRSIDESLGLPNKYEM